MHKLKTEYKILILAIGFALLIVVLNSALAAFIFNRGSFWQLLFTAPPHENYNSVILLICFLAFGLIVAHIGASRRQEMEALTRSKETLAATLDNIGHAVIAVDLHGRVTFLNPAAEKLTGWPARDTVGLPAQEIIPVCEKDNRQETLHPFDRILHGDITEDPERQLAVVARDGTRHFVEYCAAAVKDHQGLMTGAVIVFHDVTEHRHADEILQKDKETAQRYLDLAGTIMVALDAQGRVSMINRKGCTTLGLPEEKIIGHNWLDEFIPERMRRQVRTTFRRIMDGELAPVEYYTNAILTADGEERLIGWHNTVFKNEDGRIIGTLSSGEDITQQDKTLRELAEREQQFRSVFNSADDLIFVKDLGFRYTAVNPSMQALLGTPAAEIIGRSEDEVFGIAGESRDLLLEADRRVAAGETMEEELTRRVKGTPVTLHVVRMPVRDDNGTITGVCGIARNITSRKRSADALRESEARLQRQNAALAHLDLRKILVRGDFLTAVRRITETTAETLDVARVGIWTLDERKTALRMVDLYEKNSQRHSDGLVLATEHYPAYFTALEESPSIVANNAHTDPRTREFSDSYLAPLGITSMLDTPIMSGGRISGVLCCEHIGPGRRWTLDEQNFAASMANSAGLAVEISERKHKEEQLRDSERRFQGIVLSTMDWIWEVDKNGTYTFASGRIKHILGYEPEEIVGKKPFQLMSAEEAERVSRIFQEIVAEKKPIVDLENWNLTKDGREICLLTNGVPILDEEGNVVGYRGIDKDITERKHIELELRESEERYREIVERANDGIVIVQDSRMVFVNERLTTMVGYSADELLNQPFVNYIHPDQREEVLHNYRLRMAGEHAPSIYQFGLLHRDGGKVDVEVNAGVIQFNGAAANFVFVRDLTERRKIEELKNCEQLVAATIVDALEDGVYLVNRDYELIYANRSLVRQFGPYQGQKCHQYLDGRDTVCPWCRRNHATAGRPAQCQWHSSTTAKTYHATYAQLQGLDRDMVYLGALHDIGDRQLSRRSARQAREILEQIFRESLDILMIISDDGTVLKVSRSVTDMLGFPADEFVGSPVSCLFKAHSESSRDELLARLRVYGGVFDGMEIVRVDGSVCVMDLTATIIPWDDTRAVLATFREVTDRKRIENHLQENERQYRTIIENAFDLIISYTPDGFILYASPQVERYGYSVSEVVGRNLMEFIHPDDRQRVGNNLRHAVETGEEFLTECRLIGGDGIMFHVEEIGKVVRDGDKIVQLTSVVRDITDRKCAEHIINKRDQLIKNTLESLARPFYVVNADDYSIALANSATGFTISNERSTCHILAYGRPTPCEAPDLPCPLAIVKETKKPAQVEHVFTGPDGKRHISEIHGYPIFDTAGNLHQMIEYSLDITNRKQAEEELRASEEKYRTLYSTMNEGVALHELVYNQDHVAIDFRITDINPAFEQIVGRKQEDIVGRLATEVYGVTPPSMLDIFARVVETGTPTTVEEYVYSAKKVLRISVFSPGPDRFATILEDITEHKHFKDQLRILGRLPEENPNPILRVDDAGTLLFANDQCQRILQEWHVQIGDHIPQRWHDLVAQSLETNTQREQEFECGDSTYLMFIRPVTEAGYAHMYLMDLTEHRRTEKALRESELQLRQAQKMEAIGRVAGGIAHDFNNLISIIAGHAELLALRLTSDNPLSYNAREIRETAEQASRLTHQLLAFSRKQVLEPRLLDLNAVIAGMNKMLHRLIGDNIELVIIAGPGLGTVKADPGQIEQVLMNLVVNGRDAMPDGGQITIETTNADAAEDDTRESAAPPGPYVCLRVTDTGKGMDDHTRAHIFEPFFTTKESGKGTGLGLATVYGIVKQSGGYITVDSEPGRGSTFAVCLPRVNEHPDTPDRAAENEIAASPGNVVIMVVEDEKEVRDMVCNILRAQGHGVVSAQNGKDALDKYQHSGEKIRLLLTDVVMPKMSGIDLAEKLLEQRPDLKVIFISGYTKSSEIRKSPVGKNSLFLEKPFAADQLRQTIDAMLG